MNPASLVLGLAVTVAASTSGSAADSTPADSLFGKLDRNSDGKVTRDELSTSQQTMFRRALRVGDTNLDNALTRDEFTKAVTDAVPVELPGGNMAGRLAAFDAKSLDRNRDGRLTLDEIPEPMKPRFELLLDRIKQDSVPVDKLQDYLRGGTPSAGSKSSGSGLAIEPAKTNSEESGKKPPSRPSDAKKNGGKQNAGKNKSQKKLGTK